MAAEHRHFRAYHLASGREAVLEGRADGEGGVAFELTWQGPGAAQRWSSDTIERFMRWRREAERELRAEILGVAST